MNCMIGNKCSQQASHIVHETLRERSWNERRAAPVRHSCHEKDDKMHRHEEIPLNKKRSLHSESCRVFHAAGNPAASRTDYFLYTVFRLRRLCVLDGEPVSAAQQAAARSKFVGRLTLEFLEERAPGTVWSSYAFPYSRIACSLSQTDMLPIDSQAFACYTPI
jgi:hypothetical protein